jgi:acyl-CoA thioesterase-1
MRHSRWYLAASVRRATLVGALAAVACVGPLLLAGVAAQQSDGVVLFFGDSLTAGYGLDPAVAFPALIQSRIDDAALPFRVVNAGLSGETTSGGLRRIDWVLRQPVSVLVLELGGNDGLRGTDLELTEQNLQAIIDRTLAAHPGADIVLAGMQVPTNLGGEYTTAFRDLYPRLASANEATLIPFLLEGVGGVAELNLPDGIHPNVAGHRRVADNVWPVLEPLLRARAAR